jgi:hypothetical protein
MSPKITYRVLTVMAVFAILLTSCGGGSTNKLIGKWEYKEPTSGMSIVMEFTKDNINMTAAGQSQDIAYTYVDSDTIKVNDPDGGTEEEVSYTLDGDTLTMDFGGEKVEFTKVK